MSLDFLRFTRCGSRRSGLITRPVVSLQAAIWSLFLQQAQHERSCDACGAGFGCASSLPCWCELNACTPSRFWISHSGGGCSYGMIFMIFARASIGVANLRRAAHSCCGATHACDPRLPEVSTRCRGEGSSDWLVFAIVQLHRHAVCESTAVVRISFSFFNGLRSRRRGWRFMVGSTIGNPFGSHCEGVRPQGDHRGNAAWNEKADGYLTRPFS